MAEFKTWQSYREFEWTIKRRHRYILPPDMQGLLDTVLATSWQRKRDVPKGRIYWRSQLGHDWEEIEQDGATFEVQCPLPPARMKPLKSMATEGRANPKGIPYLYLSTDKDTAMAEVRPWVGSYVSVGQFKTLKDLVLIDCSVEHKRGFVFYFEEPSSEEKESAVWADIDRAFSGPVNPSDSVADYVPTQILAELFKNNGYDGIAYKSLLGPGFNVVLFDLESADLLNCFLCRADTVAFTFSEAANPYFLKKHYDTTDSENA